MLTFFISRLKWRNQLITRSTQGLSYVFTRNRTMVWLRLARNKPNKLTFNNRSLSTRNTLLDLRVDDEGIATVTMKRTPVNSLNLELLKQLNNTLDDINKNNFKGMILTSAFPTVFSAGIDKKELYKPDLKRLEDFFITFQDVWVKLFGSSFVTAAAINGHSPAGGCLLSISCEYRAMVEGFTIGLNETALGIVATDWAMDAMCHTIANREAEYALTAGRMFTADEALKVGLIDYLTTDKTKAIMKCKEFIRKFDNISAEARAKTKQKFRTGLLERFQSNRQADLEDFLENIKNTNTQIFLEKAFPSLNKKQVNKDRSL